MPRVAMDCGFLAHCTDAGLATNTILMQKLQSAVEAIDTSGLGRVLIKGDAGFAVQTPPPSLGRTR